MTRTLLIYPVNACDRVLKEGEPGWDEGEDHEEHTNQTQSDEGQSGGAAEIFDRPPLEEEDCPGADVEDGDVAPVRGLSESAVIGVKQHRDQQKPQQSAPQLDLPEIFMPPEKQPLNQSEEKQRPEEQLHVLPDRFVHPGKGRDPDALARPVVQKMQDRPAKRHHAKANPLPKIHNPTSVDGISLCTAGGVYAVNCRVCNGGLFMV